jgi:hypothetical protein
MNLAKREGQPSRKISMGSKLRIASFLAALVLSCGAQADGKLYYNIAHAINHSQYIDWAIASGANALEADLNFSDAGAVEEFQHRVMCESMVADSELRKAMVQNRSYVANPATKKVRTITTGWDFCNVQEVASSFLQTLARKPSIALFIVDSKVGRSVAKNNAARAAAGRNVIDVLNRELFAYGYRGKVIVGVAESEDQAYIQAAAEAARWSPYKSRIYFSFDHDGSNANLTISRLNAMTTDMAVYGNGISSILVGNYSDEMRAAVNAERQGKVKMQYIWTIDKQSSMENYLAIGVRGIMTNNPARLRDTLNRYFQTSGGRLATPDDPLL